MLAPLLHKLLNCLGISVQQHQVDRDKLFGRTGTWSHRTVGAVRFWKSQLRIGISTRTGYGCHSAGVCARAWSLTRICALILCAVLPTGCAIHYFDAKTGTEHLWGFGHLKMKAVSANEGVCAIVTGTSTVGVALSKHDLRTSFGIGAQTLHQLEVVTEGTGIRLEWPTGDLFDVRVGTELPPEFKKCAKRADGSMEDDG